jgi:chromosome partitioning protein
MKKILVINPKGGCGKTTIATNLASYYALWGVPVALIDYDPQKSSLEWLENRTSDLGPILGVDGSRGRIGIDKTMRRVVLDAPARCSNQQLQKLFNLADVALIPVLPSPIDIRATGHFIAELASERILQNARIGLVGNRVRENTLIYNNLQKFLKNLDIPLISSLRDTQNYIRAAEGGFGVFELPPYQAEKDIEQWRPLINWIEG